MIQPIKGYPLFVELWLVEKTQGWNETRSRKNGLGVVYDIANKCYPLPTGQWFIEKTQGHNLKSS